MEHSYEQLHKMTAAKLKEIAKGLDSEHVRGYSTMHKEHLVEAICKATGIDAFEHHVAKSANKSEMKAEIRQLKVERDSALEAKDRKKLKEVRRKIHHLKVKLRKTAV
jgi:16S rRNA C967 or C1407 C5-methylase (RsmB/RsmF family)